MQYQKRHQLLEIISEYKSDNTALKKQIDDLKQKAASGDDLNEDQQKKVDSEESLLAELAQLGL